MELINTMLQDAKALLKTAQKYAAGPHADGLDPAIVSALATAVEMAQASDTAQRNAMRDTERLTDGQDRALDKCLDLVRKLRYAAKSRFAGDGESLLKEFRIGARQTHAVKDVISEIAYLKGVAQKYAGELAPCGFKAADQAALTAAAAELERADASQELAKKAQKNATQARDAALKTLKLAVSKVRNSAKSVFAGRKDVLTEFETITRRRGTVKVSSAGAGS